MAPAVHQRPRSLGPLHAGEPVVTVIAVALQEAPPEAVEERLGMDATASRRISEQHDRRAGAAMAPVIGDDGPDVSTLRASPSGLEDRGRSEERREGKGCVSTCRHRRKPGHTKTNKKKTNQPKK